ncbi:glucosaminidase domain-containing protein [Oceanihabitans sp. 2_MG-2023]|uniref:glucosaminidase domain-containing protein n=1 Tax=Oceanihabitans sp. 2_MG-2023 TaxID=3062661 RepID=UPI0026E18E6F|nr:glucosaminidase domain-containing protein [Oceanihabitans sp. 2_MG-2023]MDO6596076.1 glucosaminidase domain-containing protein [Oceanihabitans sp. 2_MG-2023]
MKKIIVISCLTFFMFSCGSSKKVVTKKDKREVVNKTTEIEPKQQEVTTPEITPTTPEVYANSTEEYIAIYSDIAQDEMRKYGIPASITLAQGILESASGKGRLSVEANNHFGIKCHDWTGAKIYHDDDASQECFRKYNNSKYSFRDHSLFLTGRKRYSNLFDFEQDDYQSWAKGLRAAGYATDRKYPVKLISLIERYQLYRFDAEVLGKNAANNDKYTVAKGDTLYSISKKYKITVQELQELNGLNDTGLFVGQVLYVKPIPKDY